MNMKIIYLIALVPLLLPSCKKDKTEKPETIYRVKSVTNISSGVVNTYEYDPHKRLIRESKSSNQARTEYSYLSGSIKQDNYNSSGTLDDTRLHELNSDGLAVKTIFSGSYYNTRLFNNTKQLLKETEYTDAGQPMTASQYYYTGEQLDSMVIRTQANIVLQRNYYEYYADINNTIGFQHYGLDPIYGRQGPKAMKRLKIYVYDFFTGAPVNTLTYDYSYEKDTEGRIVKSNYSGTANATLTYTYH